MIVRRGLRMCPSDPYGDLPYTTTRQVPTPKLSLTVTLSLRPGIPAAALYPVSSKRWSETMRQVRAVPSTHSIVNPEQNPEQPECLA